MKVKVKDVTKVPRYEEAGFIAIAKQYTYERRNTIAVEFYRKITAEMWNLLRRNPGYIFPEKGKPLRVGLTPLGKFCSKPYPTVEVLEKLIEAKERKCFDSFLVLSVMAVDDPIILGVVKLHSNSPGQAYVIARWGKDVPLSWLYGVAK